jgi:hypothetical protein
MEQQGLLIACYTVSLVANTYFMHASLWCVMVMNTNPGDTPYTRPLAISFMLVTKKVTAY